MRFYQLFSALFALKFHGWSCIFYRVIQWHFGTSWVVTFGAFLTLQARDLITLIECRMCHTLCLLGDSLSVLRQCLCQWQCHCCCCRCCSVFVISLFTIFYHILFNFLDNFIFVFSVFLIFIQLDVQYFIIIVCLFITFLQALVHWHAYESCWTFVQASTITSLARVSIRPWRITCLRLVGDFSSIYYYYRLLNLGLFTVHFTILISL